MISLDEIQMMWKEDSDINIDDLHNESLKVPLLHSKYLDADEYLNKVLLKIDYYDTILKYLEEIIKMISNRTYQIKNSIEFLRFQAGM